MFSSSLVFLLVASSLATSYGRDSTTSVTDSNAGKHDNSSVPETENYNGKKSDDVEKEHHVTKKDDSKENGQKRDDSKEYEQKKDGDEAHKNIHDIHGERGDKDGDDKDAHKNIHGEKVDKDGDDKPNAGGDADKDKKNTYGDNSSESDESSLAQPTNSTYNDAVASVLSAGIRHDQTTFALAMAAVVAFTVL